MKQQYIRSKYFAENDQQMSFQDLYGFHDVGAVCVCVLYFQEVLSSLVSKDFFQSKTYISKARPLLSSEVFKALKSCLP
jgi:hypothetical protein